MDHAFHHLLLPGRKDPVSQLFCYNLQAPSLNLLRQHLLQFYHRKPSSNIL